MLKTLFAGAAIALVCGAPQLGSAAEPQPEPIDIGSRLELFVDDFAIDKLQGARQRFGARQPRLVAHADGAIRRAGRHRRRWPRSPSR